MPKRRGGSVSRDIGRSLPELTAIAQVAKGSVPQLTEHLTQKKQSVIPSERLRALRHFRPAQLQKLLSRLLLVGEGRSRLSL